MNENKKSVKQNFNEKNAIIYDISAYLLDVLRLFGLPNQRGYVPTEKEILFKCIKYHRA